VRLIDKDFIIDIRNELSPRDIIAESREWGPTYGVTVENFEGELERPRPAVVRVTIHLNNVSLRLWSRAVATRILEDFGEPVFLDDVSFDEHDRRAVYTMVDCHDGRMIPKSVMVHVGDFWEQVFITIVNWVAIDPPMPLENDYQFLRNQQEKFGTEDLARRSLVWGTDRLRTYYNRNRENSESSG
jgi:hypothetical protein